MKGENFENQKVGTKLWYLGYGNTAQGNDAFMMLQGNYRSAAVGRAFKLEIYVSPADDRDAPSEPVKQNVTDAALFTVGEWHDVEVYLDAGTPDHADGILRFWVDGRPVTDRKNVKFLDSRHGFVQGFFHWEWTPVWGGMGGVRDREDRMQIDHVYLAGAE